MIYKELKTLLDTLTEAQLEQQVVVLKDDEDPIIIDELGISKEDIYWEHHGECLGNLEAAKSQFESIEEWEDEKEDLIISPAGTVTLSSF